MSTTLIITLVTFIALLIMGFVFNSTRDKHISIRVLTFSSLCISLAFALSQMTLFRMPQAGSVNPASMLFITIIGYKFGLKVGLISGITFGLLNLVTGAYIVHPIQLILDYPLAFGALGISGLFRNSKHGIYVGYIAGCIGRFLFATLSGVLFFANFAEDTNPILYSVVYNMSYIVPEMIITILIISVPAVRKAIDFSIKY